MSARVYRAAMLVAASFMAVPQAGAGYHVSVDEFSLNKNGATVFTDTFDDGVPPPSNPVAPPEFFRVEGTVSESGGRLIMDQSGGIPGASALGQQRTYQSVQLNTNSSMTTDANDPNYALGLKTWIDFNASATFDYSVPTPGLVYGLRLTDFASGTPASGSDTAVLTISGGINPQIIFYQQNYVAGTTNLLDFMDLPGMSFDQVRLVLSHVANTNQISASWDYLLGGVVQGSGSFFPTATVFSDEPYVRASVLVSAPVPELESWAMMLAGLGLLGTVAKRRKAKQ